MAFQFFAQYHEIIGVVSLGLPAPFHLFSNSVWLACLAGLLVWAVGGHVQAVHGGRVVLGLCRGNKVAVAALPLSLNNDNSKKSETQNGHVLTLSLKQ